MHIQRSTDKHTSRTLKYSSLLH